MLELQISIHAPLRERPRGGTRYTEIINFNPRSLTGATVDTRANSVQFIEFQSTLPYGSDPLLPGHKGTHRQFQSTLPYGSDFAQSALLSYHAKFQSTLPYGSDICKSFNIFTSLISIHAPLRERRIFACNISLQSDFNPRSLTGATYSSRYYSWLYRHFNPRSLTGATALLWRSSYI